MKTYTVSFAAVRAVVKYTNVGIKAYAIFKEV